MKRGKAYSEAQTVLKVYPSVRLIMAISAPALPGSGEAVKQSGRKDVAVIGLSLPNLNKRYVHDGNVQAVVLWNTRDLGYLTVYTGALLAQNRIAGGASGFQAEGDSCAVWAIDSFQLARAAHRAISKQYPDCRELYVQFM
jgi:ABC-type sugar transport system substrate-binding protein